MSEISLKEYFSKLESALNEKAADEVIQHCRHILRSFPKNVTAYRLLGGALLELGRYEEAGAVLQRVLSVLPDDYAAYLGLSDAYTGQNRADDAIWHLERAFEQNPNNTKLIDRLRGLYRRFRKGENVKIQMTSAAIARQQVRNRQYEAAINTLRGTLQRSPERVDLKLLLMRALWDTGATLDAADMAVEVLTVLPNCLEANRLMTELWLSEDRPSDAQLYLNRVEAVDPYLAFELVQGEAPPDDAFWLNELDYRRAAQKELVDNRPDWLQGISSEIASGRGGLEPERPSGWTSALLAGSTAQPQEQEENPLFDDLEMADSLFNQSAKSEFGSQYEQPAAQAEESLDWLSGYSINTAAEEAEAPPEESLDWLSGYSINNMAEEDSNQVVFNDPFTTPVKKLGTQSNKLPMAWALNEDEDDQQLGVLGGTAADTESIPDWVQSGTERPEFADAYREPDGDDEDESMDWLRDEIFQDEATIQLSARQTEPLQMPKTGLPGDELPVDSDALDWYEDPRSRAPVASSPSPGVTDMLRGGNFDWMQDETTATTSPPVPSANDTEMDEWLSLFEPDAQPASSPASDWISELEMNDEQNPTSNDLPDWMLDSQPDSEPAQDTPDEPLAGDVPDWMRELAPEDDDRPLVDDEPIVAQTGELDWMSAIEDAPVPRSGQTDELSWLNPPSDTPLDADAPDWMRELQPDEVEDPFAPPAAVPTATLNWLNEDDDALIGGARTDNLSWLDDEPGNPAAAPQDAELGWLSALDTDDPTESEEEDALAAGDVPDWMSELNGDTEEDDPVEADMPDWMSDLKPEPGDVTALEFEEAVIETGDLGWLEAEEDMIPVAAPQTDSLTWLNADDEEVVAVPQTDGLSWLDSVAEDEEQPADEPIAEEEPLEIDVPDWMSDLKPQAEEVIAAEEQSIEMGDLSWLEAEEAEMSPIAAQTDGPGWLNAEDDDESPIPVHEPSPIAGEMPDWMSEVNDEEEADEPIEAEIPEWMSALEPEADAEPEPAVSAEAEPGGFEWMTDVEEAEEVQAEPAAEQDPAWLTAAEKGDFGWLEEVEASAQPQAAPTASAEPGEFEWFTEEEEKERGAQELAAMNSTPDWLTALQNDDEEEMPVSTAADTGEIDWLTVDTSDGEPEAAVAETPEWLSELNADEPTADAEEVEAIATDTPAWLSEIRAEDDAVAPAIEAAPVSTPADTGEIDWLTVDISDGEPEAAVADTPDWLSELNGEDEAVEEEEPIAAETPEWLSELNVEEEDEAVVPVSASASIGEIDWLSEDDQEDEAIIVAEEPDWLAEVRPEDEEAVPVSVSASIGELDWLSEDDNEDEAIIAAEEPDWLAAIGDAEELEAAADEVMGVPDADEEFALTPDEEDVAQESDEGLPDWVGGAAAVMSDINRSQDEPGFDADEEEATFAPTPAENAPDWLNAMVPGIDVDTTAVEAEADEPEPVMASTGSARDYNWVVEMVETEQNTDAEAVVTLSGARFTFTRPPAWLSASKTDDKLPDWPSDDDMPEWLR